MSKSYELFLHYKQGDDLAGHLKANPGDPVAALRSWSESLKAAVERLSELAYDVEKSGKSVSITADTHFIGINGDPALLEGLAAKGLLDAVEHDGDEDEDDGDAPSDD